MSTDPPEVFTFDDELPDDFVAFRTPGSCSFEVKLSDRPAPFTPSSVKSRYENMASGMHDILARAAQQLEEQLAREGRPITVPLRNTENPKIPFNVPRFFASAPGPEWCPYVCPLGSGWIHMTTREKRLITPTNMEADPMVSSLEGLPATVECASILEDTMENHIPMATDEGFLKAAPPPFLTGQPVALLPRIPEQEIAGKTLMGEYTSHESSELLARNLLVNQYGINWDYGIPASAFLSVIRAGRRRVFSRDEGRCLGVIFNTPVKYFRELFGFDVGVYDSMYEPIDRISSERDILIRWFQMNKWWEVPIPEWLPKEFDLLITWLVEAMVVPYVFPATSLPIATITRVSGVHGRGPIAEEVLALGDIPPYGRQLPIIAEGSRPMGETLSLSVGSVCIGAWNIMRGDLNPLNWARFLRSLVCSTPLRYSSAKIACDSMFPGHRTVRIHQWADPNSPHYHYGTDYHNWGIMREDATTGLRVCVQLGFACGWSFLLADLLLYCARKQIAVCSQEFYAFLARLAYDAFRVEPNDRFYGEACCHYRHREGEECPGVDQETHMELLEMRFGALRQSTQVQIGVTYVINLRDCRYNSGCMDCNSECGCVSCEDDLCLLCLCRGRGDPCACQRSPPALPQTHVFVAVGKRYIPIDKFAAWRARDRESRNSLPRLFVGHALKPWGRGHGKKK